MQSQDKLYSFLGDKVRGGGGGGGGSKGSLWVFMERLVDFNFLQTIF